MSDQNTQSNSLKTELVSLSDLGLKGNNNSENSVISADGRYIVFESYANNLVADDTNAAKDIFVRDLLNDTIELISVNSEGIQGNNDSTNPSISADGRYIAFESLANNFIDDDFGFYSNVFVHDTVDGTTKLVSTNINGNPGYGIDPSISADGRYVAFRSSSDYLVPDDNNTEGDVFVTDLVNGTTEIASLGTVGNQGNSYSQKPSISADGRYVAFVTDADNLVPGDVNDTHDIFVRDLVNDTTEIVSVNTDGNTLNTQMSFSPVISDNGRYVAFWSFSDNLTATFNENGRNIFVRDLVTNTTELVTGQGENAVYSTQDETFDISADGRYVTFLSGSGVAVRDLVNDTTQFLDLNDDDLQTSGLVETPSISADGHLVAFGSAGDPLNIGDTDLSKDIFVSDRGEFSDEVSPTPEPPITETPEVVVPEPPTPEPPEVVIPQPPAPQPPITEPEVVIPQTSDIDIVIPTPGTPEEVSSQGETKLVTFNAEDGSVDHSSVSNDGRYVVFESIWAYDDEFFPGIDNYNTDIFIRDFEEDTISLVSVGNGSVVANGDSKNADISGGGRYVVFESDADNLVPENVLEDSGGYNDIFLKDLETNTTQRISLAYNGYQANDNSYDPQISNNGRYVVFESDADNLVPDDTNYRTDIFIRDLIDKTIERVSLTANNIESDFASYNPSVSADGRYVVFESSGSDFVAGDNNGYSYYGYFGTGTDIFVRDLVEDTTKRVSVAVDGSEGNNKSFNASISTNGRYVVFESIADNLVPDDTNNRTDIFVRDLIEGTTERVSVAGDGFDTEANGYSQNASISANGRYVFFESNADNLISGDTNGYYDIFVRDLVNGTTERVSVTNDPENSQGNGGSARSSISADGRYVAFNSGASNFVLEDEGFYGKSDIFLRDRGSAFSDSIINNEVVNEPDVVDRPNEPNIDNGTVDVVDRPNEPNIDNGTVDNPNVDDESQLLLTDVHRLYQYEKGFHFYSSDLNEINYIQEKTSIGEMSYTYEAEKFQVLADDELFTGEKIEGVEPVYRFFNTQTGAHLYTMDENEKDYIVDTLANYSFEGIKYYAFETEPANLDTIPVYRMLNNQSGAHLFTIDQNEIDSIQATLPHFTMENNGEAAFHVFAL